MQSSTGAVPEGASSGVFGFFGFFPTFFTIIPLLMLAVGIGTLVQTIRKMLITNKLNNGERAVGVVVGANVQTSGGGHHSGVRTRMIETIEYYARDGRLIRAAPFTSDVGMVDREGTEVAVIYDPNRPERFVAPADGQRVGTGRLLFSLGSVVVFVSFAIIFLLMSSGFLSLFGSLMR